MVVVVVQPDAVTVPALLLGGEHLCVEELVGDHRDPHRMRAQRPAAQVLLKARGLLLQLLDEIPAQRSVHGGRPLLIGAGRPQGIRVPPLEGPREGLRPVPVAVPSRLEPLLLELVEARRVGEDW